MSINARRLFSLYRYLPFGAATAMTIAEGVRAVFNPAGRTIYGQTGEDKVIEAYLDRNTPGFYVDVGCNHPFTKSNTLSLYLQGWSGLVVDGNPNLIKAFGRLRPRDRAVCAVVSNDASPLNFTIARDHELSTVSEAFEREVIQDRGVTERVTVQPVPLQDILLKNGAPEQFALLSIDCEGHDYEVLTSFDLDQFRPGLIVVEMLNLVLNRAPEDQIYQYLTSHGYRLASYSVMNGYFVDERPR